MKPLNEYQKQQVIDVLEYNLGFEKGEIRENDFLKNDLGCDSLDAIEIAIELEKIFNISIPDEVIENIEIVSDIYRELENCN